MITRHAGSAESAAGIIAYHVVQADCYCAAAAGWPVLLQLVAPLMAGPAGVLVAEGLLLLVRGGDSAAQ
jgi:hypothetical protein